MARPRVFISYGRKDAPKALLDALEARLGAEGFHVLRDTTELTVGQEWRHEIWGWLEDCHAAIVVFSPSCLTSDFVAFEVSVLRSRRSRNPHFPLVPVLAGIEAGSLKAGRYAPASVGELTAVRHGADETQTIDAILPALAPALAAAEATPFATLAKKLAGRLAGFSAGDVALAMDRLGGPPPGWVSTGDPARDLARRLLSVNHGALAGALKSLREVATTLQKAELSAVALEAYPFTWVHPEAAEAIATAVRRAPGQRGVLLNASELDFAGRSYRRRALATADTPNHVGFEPVFTSASPTADLIEQVRERLGAKVLGNRAATVVEINEFARDVDEFQDWVVVELRVDEPDEALITALQNTFPLTTFCWLGGADLPASDPPATLVLRCAPPLGATDERQARNRFQVVSRAASGD